jgi:hypothetical protein
VVAQTLPRELARPGLPVGGGEEAPRGLRGHDEVCRPQVDKLGPLAITVTSPLRRQLGGEFLLRAMLSSLPIARERVGLQGGGGERIGAGGHWARGLCHQRRCGVVHLQAADAPFGGGSRGRAAT